MRQPPQPWFHRSMWWGTWPANAKGMLWWAGSVLAMLLALMFGVLVASRYRHSSWPRAAAAASAGVLFGVLLTIGFNAAGYREWVVGPAHFDQVLTVGPGGYVLALAALSAIVAAVLLAVA